jgi:hypothetical protein
MEINSYAIVFLMISAVALFKLPRRWAPLPLLAGACYMTLGQGIELGPFHFPVIRILIAGGLIRVIIRRERLANGMNSLDCLMVVWAIWAVISSTFHDNSIGVLVNRLGLVYSACGIYFILRVFCQSLDDVVRLGRFTVALLIPVAIVMIYEKMTGHNLFGALGGVAEISEVRGGAIRAQGPFAHAILAGTVGAACLPLVIGIWPWHRKAAVIGVIAGLSMVFACTSSGPIMSALCAIGALFMWHWRHQMRLVRWLAVLGFIGLNLIMKAPVYYLIARIDITGSSTGWHRAALIDSALAHLSEWWLAGTDFTRHWMPYGVLGNENHADITNYYLRMGIDGGLPLMLLFIAMLVNGFSFVGQILNQADNLPSTYRFMIWSLGASLFTYAVTFLSVSLHDQSFLFFYLTLATISSCLSGNVLQTSNQSSGQGAGHGSCLVERY